MRGCKLLILLVSCSILASAWVPNGAILRQRPLSRNRPLRPFMARTTRATMTMSATASRTSNNNDKGLYTPPQGSLLDQTIVITGATSGLGLESARRLAVGGANVILTARTDQKGQAAVQAVKDHLQEQQVAYPTQTIRYKVVDLDDLSSIRQAVANWNDDSDNTANKIDVLLNNAGIMALPKREITVNGWERQVQSNHLGHFLLTGLLSPQLSDDARIVTVSSTAHTIAGSKGMDWDYCWTAGSAATESSSLSPSVYGPWRSYGQSKLANILFTQELHRKSRAAGRNWTAVTLHPGVVATDLARYMMPSTSASTTDASQGTGGVGGWLTNLFLKGLASFLKTPAQGATTQVWLASRADQAVAGAAAVSAAANGSINDIGGKYFVDCQEQELPWYATDAYAARRLWTESQERVGGVEYAFDKVAAAADADIAPIKETIRQD